jgi:ATP-dependent Clp protease adaptor protein ClpS
VPETPTPQPSTQTAEPKLSKQAARAKPKIEKLPPFNVVLLDDDDHTYDYVIEMLQKLFGHSKERAYQMAKEVDTTGRVIVFTSHRERAELKRDQIHAYGADFRMETSHGAMSAIVEPAMGDSR